MTASGVVRFVCLFACLVFVVCLLRQRLEFVPHCIILDRTGDRVFLCFNECVYKADGFSHRSFLTEPSK